LRLRPLPSRNVIEVLEKVGFQRERQKGSHAILKHPDGRVTVVPVHKGENIGKGLLRKIIKDARLSREEFLKLAQG
jgi:predicted RNA binding protein YcfA (HicA-like mRNA interferase family)